jgi:hypothetical protein
MNDSIYLRLVDSIRRRGLDVGSSPEAWLARHLLPLLADAGLEVADTAERTRDAERHAEALARAEELREGARAQCVRRTAERDEALVRLRIADRDAVFGRAVLGLANELLRLRAMMEQRPDAFTTDGSPESIAIVLANELAEVNAEQPGSEAAQRECGDVFAAAVHLLLAHDACLLEEVDTVLAKIEARLDAMDEHGCTWAEAKQAVQLSIN